MANVGDFYLIQQGVARESPNTYGQYKPGPVPVPVPPQPASELVGVKDFRFAHTEAANTSPLSGGTAFTTLVFDTTSRADSAQILLSNGSTQQMVITSAGIYGKPIHRLSGTAGLIHDKYINYESIAVDGDMVFEIGNNMAFAPALIRALDRPIPAPAIRKHNGSTLLTGCVDGKNQSILVTADDVRSSILEIVAFHEAGHIIAGASVGAQFQQVIIANGRGHTDQLVRNYKQEFIITAAGMLAGLLRLAPYTPGQEDDEQELSDWLFDFMDADKPADDDSAELRNCAVVNAMPREEQAECFRAAIRCMHENWSAIRDMGHQLAAQAITQGVSEGMTMVVPADKLQIPFYEDGAKIPSAGFKRSARKKSRKAK